MVYLESSALVKLVLTEPETAALRAFLEGRGAPISSELALVEVLRAARRRGESAEVRARGVLGRLALRPVRRRLLESAAALGPPSLRSLDAIHVATAAELGASVFVSYDGRVLAGARGARLPVAAPGSG